MGNSEENQTKKDVQPFTEINFLENIFYLGFVESEPTTVYKDEKVELIVVFRTLTPSEVRDIVEYMNKFESSMGKIITERIETLARAIVTINHMPLVLSAREQEDFSKKNNGRNLSPLEMARIIVEEKIRSIKLIDVLYDAYIAFADSVYKKFDDAKKNLN